jgi:hypothetical protein
MQLGDYYNLLFETLPGGYDGQNWYIVEQGTEVTDFDNSWSYFYSNYLNKYHT